MKSNLEKTVFDKVRMLVGTLVAAGIIVFMFAVFFSFALLPTLLSILLILLGVFIAGSLRLASLIYELLS